MMTKLSNILRRVSIIGLGLMGGSLGLALKRSFPTIEIVGVDREEKIVQRAVERGAIDRGFLNFEEAFPKADLIVLATPVNAILELLPTLPDLIDPDTLVTDLGSTKARICRTAEEYLPDRFIGGHPMAGSERQGIEAADPFLFENALYVLTPLQASQERIPHLSTFLEELGARILCLDPQLHDQIVAYVSHLPQLLAVALTELVGQQNEENSLYRELAAGGFRDMTRIAASPYSIWKDILRDNAPQIGHVLDALIEQLLSMRGELTSAVLEERFRRAAAFRTAIPLRSKGFLKPLHRIAISVPDQPGTLARLTTVLAQSTINIKDIELLKVRENVGGTFHLHFETRAEAERAVQLLQNIGYSSSLLD
jgi:prephenate dehydrogenase